MSRSNNCDSTSRGAHRVLRLSATALLLSTATLPAIAADGYFQNGIGVREKALAGSGVADGTDATAISLNPAGLANVGNEMTAAVSALNYHRGYSSTGTGGVTAGGEHVSDNEWFAVPNLAINRRVSWGFADAIGFSVYGNGGINTHYADAPNANCPPGLSGLNCGGPLGLNLVQTFFSIGLAKQLAPGVSVGVAPILARQQFELHGVGLFAGLSSNPANFSDQGTVNTWGAGVKGGLELTVIPGVKFGISGTSRINMGHMAVYSGLLADQAKLDIPANMQAGFSFQVRPDLKLFTDYRHIWYSAVGAIANPSTNPVAFGLSGGPGFGARDLDVYKIGLEWQQSRVLTLRTGYSYGSPMFRSSDTDLNVLTGGAARHHLTSGLRYQMTDKLDLELAGMYAPRTNLAGAELFNSARNVEINARQFELTVGAVYRFDSEKVAPPLK